MRQIKTDRDTERHRETYMRQRETEKDAERQNETD